MAFSNSRKMVKKSNSQVELEDILKKKVIEKYETLDYEGLEAYLNRLDISLISNAIEKFLDESDPEIGRLAGSLDEKILNNDLMMVESTLKEVYVSFDATKDGNTYSEIKKISTGEYLTDNSLIAIIGIENPKNSRTSTSLTWADFGDSIQIKESSNKTEYKDKRGEAELFGSSRLKRDCTRKFTRYIIDGEDLGEEGFPRDCGGIRFHTQKLGDLYIVEDIIEREVPEIEFKDKSKDIDYRNMPERYDNFDVREAVEASIRRAREYAPEGTKPSKDDIFKMMAGIWMDVSFNGFPMEIQLLPTAIYNEMDFHRLLNHPTYKKNQEKYEGKARLIEKFMEKVEKHRLNKLKITLRDRAHSPLLFTS